MSYSKEDLDLLMGTLAGPFVRVSKTQIDCIMIHPIHGRIPYTAGPGDARSEAIYKEILARRYTVKDKSHEQPQP